jgi:hypothetical protein
MRAWRGDGFREGLNPSYRLLHDPGKRSRPGWHDEKFDPATVNGGLEIWMPVRE